MLPKHLRLPATVRLHSSETIHTSFATIKISRNTATVSRFGFICGKKVDKRAVVRNRLKRRVRSCVESLQKEIESGYDVLFLLKKEGIVQDTPMLCREIRTVFQKRHVILIEK